MKDFNVLLRYSVRIEVHYIISNTPDNFKIVGELHAVNGKAQFVPLIFVF